MPDNENNLLSLTIRFNDTSSNETRLPYTMPQAEYMYGCVPTAVGMLLGYYDKYGYMGYDVSNIIPGEIDVYSRGLDGNAYDMDAFDTVLGKFIASEEYVSRFIDKTPQEELNYTFVDGKVSRGLNVSVFNCLADWLGSGQYWRGNDDLSTTYLQNSLKTSENSKSNFNIDGTAVPVKYFDFKYGLQQYLKTVGYSLDGNATNSIKADVIGGSFTFKDYMAEIDAGRGVLLSVVSDDGYGHMMLGYGYDKENQKLIFDDAYSNGMSMCWNGTYEFSDSIFHLDSVTTVVFDTTGLSAKVPIVDDVEYEVNLTINGRTLNLPYISGEGLELYGLSEAETAWTVSPAKAGDVTAEGNGNFAESLVADPQLFQSVEDGIADAFLGRANNIWSGYYYAQHVGACEEWSGTAEKVGLNGKNRIADVFSGSEDSTLLYLTDDDNGDALFVEDIYTNLPEELSGKQARIAKIDQIFAGAGDDLIDMTSGKFEYAGGGVVVHGGLGDDVIWANSGANVLFGDAGDDRLVGGAGDDVLVGGSGDDSMHGGGGNDVFCFCENWGMDTVEQLAGGKVTLWFASGDISNWNAGALTYTDGNNAVSVSGVSADNVSCLFGDDGSALYDKLLAEGAFSAFSSKCIFA